VVNSDLNLVQMGAAIIVALSSAAGLWVVVGKIIEKLLPDTDARLAGDAAIRGELWRQVGDLTKANAEWQARILATEREAMEQRSVARERDTAQTQQIGILREDLAEVHKDLLAARQDILELRAAVAELRACPDCPLLGRPEQKGASI
jgi:hypothetical protein